MENNKVAVMTWYTYRNYGTALQASALVSVLESLGYDPRVIQYRPRREIRERQSIATHWRRLFAGICVLPHSRFWFPEERSKLFLEFLDARLRKTEPYQSMPELKELNKEYAAFICGSDQIWSLNGFDDNYFLPFVEQAEKKVAYAPSLGGTRFRSEVQKKRFIELISSFRYLSLRESQSVELIRDLTGQTAEAVLDPTLLLDGKQWDAYLGSTESRLPDRKYILCFFLGDPGRYRSFVKKLSACLELPYYVIPMTEGERNGGHGVPFEVGPGEFVSLIRNAAFVCTDSFHGTAFAVNYHIPFCVFERFRKRDPGSQNMRITSFLGLMDLEDRLVSPSHTAGIRKLAHCDFSAADEKLRVLRRKSLEYLGSALKEASAAVPAPVEGASFRIADQCCGCGACAAVCPVRAVHMEENEEGFLQCRVDESLCLKCGKCREVCPMQRISAPLMANARALYDARSASAEVRMGSSSGGIGQELARLSREMGHAVCGCVYERESRTAKHLLICPEDSRGISGLRGSKYLQSRTVEAMKEIWQRKAGEPLTFFGTPCQTAAVDRLLKLRGCHDRAILVDLVCHGVPSAKLWDRYLCQLDERYGTGEHPAVSFRYKDGRSSLRLMRVEGNGKCYVQNERKDDFYAFFRRGLCHMDSCYECPYRERSAADIRLGDYWLRFADDQEAHSMVIANTDRGQDILMQLKERGLCGMREYPLEEYWTVQYPYNTVVPLDREQILRDLRTSEEPLHVLRKRYCGFHDTREAVMRGRIVIGNILRFLRR